MNSRSVSKDLAELAELIKLHYRSLGLDEEAALKQTVALVEQIGHRFNGDTLYISISDKNKRKQRVYKLLSEGLSIRAIAKRTGFSRSSISRMIKKNN